MVFRMNDIGDEYIDALSGLCNRRYMNMVSFEYIREADRENKSLSVVIIDLDHFKNINDTYGHSMGDTVLIEFAHFLQDLLRENDTVFRYGGDEFVCLLPDTEYRNAEKISLRFLDQCHSREFARIKMTYSIGIASYPSDGNNWLSVFNAADQRLYSAKRHGRDRIGSFSKESKKVDTPIREIIGREEEIVRITSAINKKVDGGRGAVCISGEIGVGKTRLVHEIVNDFGNKKIPYLESNLSATTKSIPYYPFREIIRNVFRKKGSGCITGIPQAFQIELVKIVPELSDELVKTDDSAFILDKFRLFEGVRRFFERQASTAPLFVCLDNIHWADNGSLELFSYMVRSLKESPVFFFFIYRVEEARDDLFNNLLQSMERERLYDLIELEPLELADVARMISFMVDTSPSQELTAYIYRETGGNPFFIEELMRSLELNGALIWDNGEILLNEDVKVVIPHSVKGVVDRKVSMISHGACELLEYAAVIGREFDFVLLSEVTGINEENLFDLIDEIRDMRLLKEIGEERFCFSEDVIREVIYQQINTRKLTQYHQMVGDRLLKIHGERIEEAVDELSYHYYLSGDKVKAIKFSIIAAERAKDAYANRDAIEFYSKALDCLEDVAIEDGEPKKIECLRNRADVLEMTGEIERALEDLDKAIGIARATGNRIKEAECLLSICDVCQNRSQYDEAEKKADEALSVYRELNDKKGEASCFNCIGTSYLSRGKFPQALDYYNRSLSIQVGINDLKGKAKNLNSIGIIHGQKGKYPEALKCFQKAMEIKTETGDRRGVAASLNNIGIVHDHIGDHSKALDFSKKALKLIEELGDRRGEAITLNNIGIGSRCLGDISTSLVTLRRALRISEEIDCSRTEAAVLINIGIIHDYLGELSKALETYRRSVKIQKMIGDREGEAASLLSIGDILVQQGIYAEGEKYYRSALVIAEEIESKMLMAYIYLGFTSLNLEKGDLTGAEENLRQTVSVQDELASKEIDAHIHHCSGRIYTKKKKWKEAETSFSESENVFISTKNKFQLGQVFYYHGSMFYESGDVTNAGKSFDKANKIFGELGAAGWLEKTESFRGRTPLAALAISKTIRKPQ